jgi:hypothetical protein
MAVVSGRPKHTKDMKKHSDPESVVKLDRHELKPHYDLDYRKAKPNRFADRVKVPHGSTRPGADRKRAPEQVERHTITLTKSHVAYLHRLDANLSIAIRKLIAKAGKARRAP